MLLGENIALAISSLKANKMRAFLTMLGIIIGISAVIAIFTVGNSLNLSVSETMQSVGANDIYVSVTPRSEDDADENASSKTLDGLKFAPKVSTGSMQDSDKITGDMIDGLADFLGDKIKAINVSNQAGSISLKAGDEEVSASLVGTSVGYFVTNAPTINAGAMFSAEDFTGKRRVCLVEEKLVEDLFGGDSNKAVGSEMKMTLDGKEYPVTIVGVYEANNNSSMGGYSSFGYSSSSIYMPLTTVNELIGSKNLYTMFLVVSAVGTNQDDLIADIQSYFKPYYRNNDNYKVTVISFDSLLQMLYTLLDTITTAISIIAGIALLVGGIGVMNIMLVSVTERTKEIGTRKALGAKNSSIRAQFIVEAMIICLIGGAIGVVLGISLGILASNILGYPAAPSIPGIIIALVFSMGIGVFFGYFPANKAAKMNPIDALRYE